MSSDEMVYVDAGAWCTIDPTPWMRIPVGLWDDEVQGVYREVWIDNCYRLPPGGWQEPVDVADCGAHIGIFSVLAAKLGATVAAWEPNEDNLAGLHYVLDSNGLNGLVKVHEAAVGGASGTGWFRPVGRGPTATIEATDDLAGVAIIAGLDEVIGRGVALLKLDVEGSEYEAIADMCRVDLVGRIAMEFHGPGLATGVGGCYARLFGDLVAKLAEWGRLETIGRPSVGGMLHWDRY